MNTTPIASTSRAVTTALPIEATPIPRVMNHVASVDNSSEKLSSFEIVLQQKFTHEILVEILRRLPPTRQVGHPWQRMLPEQYSVLLDRSKNLPDAPNFKILVNLLPLIPHDWQYDAVNAICENFIKRIDSFSTFSAVIDFVLDRKKSDNHTFILMLLALSCQTGKFKICDGLLNENLMPLPLSPLSNEEHKDCIDKKLVSLFCQEEDVIFDTNLQYVNLRLFINHARYFERKVKNKYIDKDDIANQKIKEDEEKALRREYDTIVIEMTEINNNRVNIDPSYIPLSIVNMSKEECLMKIKELSQLINVKINLLNNNRRHLIDRMNTFVFKLISRAMLVSTGRIPKESLERITLKLISRLSGISTNNRNQLLQGIINSELCSIPVLAALAKTLNEGFYEFSYSAMKSVADKMEEFYHKGDDVSDIISTLHTCLAREPLDPLYAWNDINTLSAGCQKILRDNLK